MRRWYGFGVGVVAATYIADIWLPINYQLAADISLICIAVWASLFAIRYAFWSRWWSTRIGRVFLANAVVLALVLIQGAVSAWWPGDYPGRGAIRFAIYTLGSTAFVPMVITLWCEQRRARRRAAADRIDERE